MNGRLLENKCPVAMQKYPFFEHQLHARASTIFSTSLPACTHRRRCIGVIHGDGRLSDDRPGVEIVGHDMGGGTDNFDATLVGLMIGLAPMKADKKEW